jgi:hypothetical protein
MNLAFKQNREKDARKYKLPETFPKLFKIIGENWVRTLDIFKIKLY